MTAIDQYIDLYASQHEAVDAHSAPVLNAMRHDALEALQRAGTLPTRRTEGYEKTSIDEMFAPDYGINVARLNIPVDVAATFRCDVPSMTTMMAFVVNDKFAPSSRLTDKLPEGMIVDSLAHAAATMPELVGKYYGRLAPIDNAGVALNTMFVQDGVFIYVPRGVRPGHLLQLVNIFSSPMSLLAFRRMLIVIEDDAELQMLVCDHTQDSTNNYLSSQVVEVFVGRGARFDICDIEESSVLTSRYSQLFASQAEGAHLYVNGITLTCGSTRNNYDIDINGRHCDTRLCGMAIGSNRQHIDNCSNVNHLVPQCRSEQLFKYVLDDDATGAFEGSILVADGAELTEAYQSNRNLLASTGARMHSKPQLEIYCDDVKCSHGATTGQLDADALFYMRQRGIPEQEARLMLMQAFMADVIDTVNIDGLRERLRHLVEKRFMGYGETCADCSASCHGAKA